MRKIRQPLIVILTLSLAVMTLTGASLSAGAILPGAQQNFDRVGYGTYEDGVIPTFDGYSRYHPAINGDGHPNLNFEQGLKYWTCSSGRLTDRVKLNKDPDGNTYITIVTEKEYSGISAVKFPCSKLKPGDTPGLLYKWRGKQHAIQIVFDEHYKTDLNESAIDIKYIAHQSGRKEIWAADEDDPKEWNISLTLPDRGILPAEGENPNLYYTVGVETTKVAEAFVGTDIDDIQIVKCDIASGTVNDLDGKLLYNLNSLPKRETIDYDFKGADAKKDPIAGTKFDIEAVLKGNKSLTSATGDDNEATTDSTLLIAIVATAIVLIAAAVVTVVLIKKKKATVKTEETNQELDSPQE